MEQFLKDGIVFGQTAYDIYTTIPKVNSFCTSTLYLKVEPEFFDIHASITGLKNDNYRMKKITNCILKTTINNVTLFLCKSVNKTTIEPIFIDIMINSLPFQIKLENIVDTTINILLEPILNLRNCKDMSEALANWALNKIYLQSPVYINFKKIKDLNMINIDLEYLNDKIDRFLIIQNVRTFVPQKFLNKVRKIQKTKTNLFVDFMAIINDINRYFVKKVGIYHKHLDEMTYYYLDFPIELYGVDSEVLDDTKRTRLLLYDPSKKVPEQPSQLMLGLAYALFGTIPQPPPLPKTYLRLKSTLIFQNLRWFFNTRCNGGKAFGFNGISGLVDGKYGQTFYKYDDVILWLVTHPNTIEEVEFVVLDPIPQNYIYF